MALLCFLDCHSLKRKKESKPKKERSSGRGLLLNNSVSKNDDSFFGPSGQWQRGAVKISASQRPGIFMETQTPPLANEKPRVVNCRPTRSKAVKNCVPPMIVARSFERFFRPGPVFKARGVGATARLYEETTKERSRGCGCGCEARPCSPERGRRCPVEHGRAGSTAAYVCISHFPLQMLMLLPQFEHSGHGVCCGAEAATPTAAEWAVEVTGAARRFVLVPFGGGSCAVVAARLFLFFERGR